MPELRVAALRDAMAATLEAAAHDDRVPKRLLRVLRSEWTESLAQYR